MRLWLPTDLVACTIKFWLPTNLIWLLTDLVACTTNSWAIRQILWESWWSWKGYTWCDKGDWVWRGRLSSATLALQNWKASFERLSKEMLKISLWDLLQAGFWDSFLIVRLKIERSQILDSTWSWAAVRGTGEINYCITCFLFFLLGNSDLIGGSLSDFSSLIQDLYDSVRATCLWATRITSHSLSLLTLLKNSPSRSSFVVCTRNTLSGSSTRPCVLDQDQARYHSRFGLLLYRFWSLLCSRIILLRI